jgi:hypothetical protein
MNHDDLCGLLRSRPLQPFRLHVTDGSHYGVDHPEMIRPFRRTGILGLGGDLQAGFCERPVTIALLHIVRALPRETATGRRAKTNWSLFREA